jgi:hypothetical protein
VIQLIFLIKKINADNKDTTLTYVLNTHLQGKINLALLKLVSISLRGFSSKEDKVDISSKMNLESFMSDDDSNNDLAF